MVTILHLSTHVEKLVTKHGLHRKLTKQVELLRTHPEHPSLHVELLEPKKRGIYSFRIDRKYRALFIFRSDKKAVEIISITVHYH